MAGYTFRGKARTASETLRRKIRASARAIAAERVARAFWPFFSALCFVLALTLLGLFEVLPATPHLIVAGVAVGIVFGTLWFGFWRLRLPREAEARARLDEGQPLRPLATLSDTQAAGLDDAFARAVWQAHQRRAEAAAERLTARAADLRLARFDGWALRLFAPALLLTTLIGAGSQTPDRLLSFFQRPAVAQTAPEAYARAPAAEGWAVPPAYTGQRTVYLDRETPEFTLPEGSALTIRVTDLDGAPGLAATGLAEGAAFAELGAGLSELRTTILGSGEIAVTGGGETLARWRITVTPDAAPAIRMVDRPIGTYAGGMEVKFEASDDIGVVSAWAEITPVGGIVPGKGLIEEPVSFALPLPITGDPRQVADSTIHDMSEHPLAGGRAVIVLHAEDGAGQRASTEPMEFEVPGRTFTNRLARALVEQRRELAIDFATAPRVLDVVQAVTRRPSAVFQDKHGAYLATRSAIRRLAFGLAEDDVPGVAAEVTELLWQAALELDGGDLNSALDRLRAAEQALRDALENGTEEDIRRAMDEMRAAMDQYLREMARQAMERGMDPNQQQQQGQQGNEITQQDLNEMLDEMQRRAESGLRDQAREMLSELSRMLENLQAGNMQPGQQGQGQGQQAMQQLQELIERQRDLSDRTFGEARRDRREGQQQGQQGDQSGQQPGQGQQGDQSGQGQRGQGQGQQPGQGQMGQGQGQPRPGEGQPGGLSGEQQALRQMLEDLLGQIPGGEGTEDMRRALEEAGRAMDGARSDLDRGAPGEAVDDQMEALDRLNEGANALAQQMQQQGQGQQSAQGDGRGRGDGRDAEGADPFDRPAGTYGAIDGRDTGVPDRSALDRAREVLEELRRRAGEPMRPQLELEYLDRLIEPY